MINLDRLAEIEKIAEKALGLLPSSRAAFIASACHNDAELQTAVEAIVAASSTPTASFETASSLGLSPREEIKLKAGETVAHFVIREPLDEGGMGAVYVAHDTVIDRDVALKILSTRLSQVSLDKLGARFATSYIPAVYEIGETAAGLTYIAMELVDGVPITTFCEGLTLKTRLTLFRDVCAGVAVIHAEPMVHRDLKPDNILVTKEGVPKILDFGTARLLSADPSLTLDPQPNDRFLSPEFASPEQLVRTGLTVATDIYSLGVLFCLLLAGRLPYRIKTRASLPWAIANLEPERPSVLALTAADGDSYPLDLPRCSPPPVRPKALAKSLSGDLDAIAIKCLQKEPKDRYLSVQDLSKDISNYFEPRPVSARRPTVRVSLSKAVRRNLLAIVVIVGLLIFTAVLSIQEREARYQRDQAQQQATRAEKVSQFLTDLFKLSDPARRPGGVVTARELLDKAARDLPRDLRDQPETLVPLLNTLGVTYENLDLMDQAGQCHRLALRIAEDRLSPNSLQLASAMFFLAVFESKSGHHREAEALQRKTLKIRQHRLPYDHPDIANSLYNIGVVAYKQERLDEAEHYYKQALDLRKAAPQADEEAIAVYLNALGVLLFEKHRYAEAESTLREALGLRTKIYGKSHPMVATTLNNLAIAIEGEGRLDEAEQLKRRALAIDRSILGANHTNVAVTLSNLGFLLLKKGDHDEAVVVFREAREIAKNALGIEHFMTVAIQVNLARSLRLTGKLPEASRLLEEVYDAAFKLDKITFGNILKTQAEILYDRDEFQEAEAKFQQAIDVFISTDSSYRTLATRAELGSCLVRQGRFAEAEPPLLAYYKKATKLDKPDALERLHDLYKNWGKAKEVARYRKIIEEYYPSILPHLDSK